VRQACSASSTAGLPEGDPVPPLPSAASSLVDPQEDRGCPAGGADGGVPARTSVTTYDEKGWPTRTRPHHVPQR